MDIVGNLGYSGQDVVFIGQDLFAYVSGKGICIIGLSNGIPREIIWRADSGVGRIASHPLSRKLAIAPHVAQFDVEIVEFQGQNVVQGTSISLTVPSAAKIVDIIFARDGENVYAISGPLDPKVFSWNLRSRSVNFVSDLQSNFTRITVNPSDKNKFILSGDEGVSLGSVIDIMGVSSVKFEKVKLLQSGTKTESIQGEGSPVPESSIIINFAYWAPYDRILVGTSLGTILEVNVADSCVRVRADLSKFTNAGESTLENEDADIPMAATMSTSHLIVGTSNGRVIWFPFVEADNDSSSIYNHSQVMQLQGQVKCLASDPTFQHLLAGSSGGTITKYSLDVIEQRHEETEEDVLDASHEVERGPKQESLDRQSSATTLCTMQSGAVLCAKSFPLPVLSTTEPTQKTSVAYSSIFATGSHSGTITFWKQPQVDAEAIAGQVGPDGAVPGIRRSMPRTIKAVSTLQLALESTAVKHQKPNLHAAVCMETLNFNQKSGNALLMVGMTNGTLGAWKVCAFEAEEEEETHADEEEATIQIKASCYFQRLLYRSSLTLISASTEEKKSFFVALGSSSDERIFVLKVPSDFTAPPNLVYCVNLHVSPVSSVYVNRTFWIGGHNGSIFSFVPSRAEKGGVVCEPHGTWESSLTSMSFMCSSNKGESLVVSRPEMLKLRVYQVSADSSATGRVGGFEPEPPLKFKNPWNDSVACSSDSIICMTSSPNGAFVGTGSVDGSVHVWTASAADIKLAARVAIHRQPVISLSFSADSSLLMSCSADGSVFLSTVGTATRLTFKAALGDAKFFDRVSADADIEKLQADTKPQSAKTWFEAFEEEAFDDLKKRSASKVGEVRSVVDEISLRLKSILERNNSRADDIEKLDRSEMVVDLEGRNRILSEAEVQLALVREVYSERNLWNEICASRVRDLCWDSMGSHERRIYSFNEEKLYFVSSFSIQGSSDEYKRRLDVVKRQRAIEIRSQRASGEGIAQRLPGTDFKARTCWAKSISGFSTSISWIANDGTRWPTDDVVGMLLKKDTTEDSSEVKTKSGDEKTAGSSGDGGGGGDASTAAARTSPSAGVDDDDEMSVHSLDPDREIDEANIFNLLYAPETVRTEVQKRTQIMLLTEVCRMLRTNFNKYFDAIATEKDDVVASIESRNVRIAAILEELKETEQLYVPKISNYEVKDSVVTVSDEELNCRPYESESAREARLREEEARRKREAEADAEDIKGRALEEMMHGTLEVKRDVLADVSAFAKPSWMDELSPSEMTEAQIREVEAFESKLKALQEEQVKYRKTLEQEMKKLKSESAEACRQFDEKLANVSRVKVLVLSEILAQELYIARLGLTMAKREQLWNLMKSTEVQIETLRKDRQEMRTRAEQFNQHVESVKGTLNALQEEEKNMDKTFKRDFQVLCNNNFDQDTLKIFYDLFRRREYAAAADEEEEDGSQDEIEESYIPSASGAGGKTKSSRRADHRASKAGKSAMNASRRQKSAMHASKKASAMNVSKKGGAGTSRIMKASKGGANAMSNMGGINKERLGPMQAAAAALKEEQMDFLEKDPFFLDILQREKAVRVAEAKIPLMVGLDIDNDCPENFVVDQYTWSKLQELRFARIDKEIQSKRMALEYATLKRKLDDLMNEEAALVSCIGALRQTRDETLTQLESIDTNLELLVCLKQGQDEVDRDAVVTDYSEAMLVPTSVVNKFNTRIKELGKEKIGVLSRIKMFRRKINLTEWNSHHLTLEAKHMEECFTDFQLLRVTRELQQVIRDGSNADQSKDRLEKVAIRRDFLQKNGESKAAKMQRSVDLLKRQLIEREDESSQLERQIRDLKLEVTAAKNVRDSNNEARGILSDNPTNDAVLKMKKIMARRHLLDSARAQAEEADFLRQELDRLRQRTFPSFAKAVKQRLPGNHFAADER